MKKRIISFILVLSMVFTMTSTAFASEQDFKAYTLVQTAESPYGTVYYVTDQQGRQTRTVWDVVDIVMAGASWAKLFSDPSWGNFGWAVLDTAAILPALPSTAYFRKGGKILLKPEEVAKFAKTSKGKRTIQAAMKTYRNADGITPKAIKEINRKFKGTEAKRVLKLFQDAANKGLVGKQAEAGIKKITPTRKIGLKYTHEIKITNKQYGDCRIFGYKTSSGQWVFDLFDKGKSH